MSTAIARTNGAAPAPLAGPQPQLPIELAPILTLLEKLTTALLQQPQPVQPREQGTVYITLQEASDYLGLTVGFLEKLIREGKLKKLKDRHVKVKKADLDKLEL